MDQAIKILEQTHENVPRTLQCSKLWFPLNGKKETSIRQGLCAAVASIVAYDPQAKALYNSLR